MCPGRVLAVSTWFHLEMSDTGLTVPDMTEPPCRYEITITVDHGGGMPIPGLADLPRGSYAEQTPNLSTWLQVQRVTLSQKMSDTGPMVPGMTESPDRYNVTVTVDRDGGTLPDPADFCRCSPSSCIEQERQRHQCPHSRTNHHHRHSRDLRLARSRGRRPGRGLRCAKASGRVTQPLSGQL